MPPAFRLPVLVLLLSLPIPAHAQVEALTALAGRLIPHRAAGPVVMTHDNFLARRQAMFDRLDADGDGVLDQAEQAGILQSLQAIPVGRDGAGQTGAVRAAMEPASVDRDGDGRITAAEFAAASEGLFAILDRDGDGAITRADAVAN